MRKETSLGRDSNQEMRTEANGRQECEGLMKVSTDWLEASGAAFSAGTIVGMLARNLVMAVRLAANDLP